MVVIDEAGMADTRQLSRLAAYAAAARAKLVLVGDPDQIPEVGAGGAFRHLVDRAGPAVVALRENHRQSDAGDCERLGLIRDGRAAAAIASARADGRWHTRESADDVRAALLADWYDDPGRIGTDKLMVATTVAEVERLNAAARALLAADGHLGAEALVVNLWAPDRAVPERELRVGDRVRATRNLYPADLLTGKVGTVVAVDAQRFEVTVALDPVGEEPERWVRLDRAYLTERRVARRAGVVEWERPGLTHAYASTANAVQGRTSVRAYVLVTEAGLYRQATYVAASRASLQTHYYAVTVPDVDELARHERAAASPEPDPGDTVALAEAMARDGSQTMASVADPLAAQVGPLLAVPTPWLWAEREQLAARLGAPVPLPEALRRVRTRLAAAYGLSLKALECQPLTDAMTRALQVPGATPGRLATLMLRRHQAVTRELDSARDPIAVLVWAAGDHAVKVLGEQAAARAGQDRRSPEERAADAAGEARLRLLEVALARQREGRLALVASEPHSPAVVLLGPLPDHPGGAGAWRSAAAAILDYRDAAGIFDRQLDGDDPLHRSLGPRPADPRLARHYDQVRARAAAARAAILRADLARHVPEAGERDEPAVAGLARRPLAELEGVRGPVRVAALPPALMARAITLRERLLRSNVLEHMPSWALRDVAARTADDRACMDDAATLAKTYGDIAVDLDRRGLRADRLADDIDIQATRALASPLPYGVCLRAGATPAPEQGLGL